MPNADDDDEELELEPIDPEILEIERKRGQKQTEDAVAKVDVDELYRDRDADGYDVDWQKLRSFRFRTRHVLFLTAVLALALALLDVMGGCGGLYALAMIGVAAGWYGAYRFEQRQEAERVRRREEFLSPGSVAGQPDEVHDSRESDADAAPRREFKFAFSPKQVLITVAISAAALAVLAWLGSQSGSHAMSIAIGAAAAAGLCALTFGWLDGAPGIVFGWWVLLALYLALGVLRYLWADDAPVQQSAAPDRAFAAAPRDC